MKKILLTIASAALLSSTAQAQNIFGDDSSIFASPFVGYGFDSEEIYGGVAVGIESGQNQFYLQYGLMSASDFGIDLDLDAISIGYTHTNPISDTMNLYLGGSIGYGSIDVSTPGGSADDSGLYFDLKAGAEIKINDSASLLAGIRYFYFEEPLGIGEALDDVSLEVGIKFTF